MKSSALFGSFAVGAAAFGAFMLRRPAPVALVAPVAPTARPTPKPTPRVLPAALRGQMMPGVWILCYHRVDEKPVQYTVLRPDDFRAQMAYLKEHDFNVVPLGKIVDALQYGEKLPPRTVALTFDDGYKDNYTVAYPILKQYNYPATLFIYPYYISNGGAALSWAQLKEMSDDPLIDVQSHTFNHPDLVRIGRHTDAKTYQTRLRHEMVDSRAKLEQKLGVKIETLAYPYGSYNDAVLRATRGAGYRSAFGIGTTPIHFIGAKPTDLWTVPRIPVSRGDSLQVWASRLQTPAPHSAKLRSAKKTKFKKKK